MDSKDSPHEVAYDSDSDDEARFADVVTGLQTSSLEEKQTESEEKEESVLQIEKDITKALAAKEVGNEKFRNKLYDESIQHYSIAISYCPIDDENKDNLGTFYGNRAAAYFSIEEYQQTVTDCTESLKLKPDYVKVLIRRSQAHEKLGNFDEALTGKYCIINKINRLFGRIMLSFLFI